MHIQVLSDLHLETETFNPVPAAQAEVLVLAGDIDRSWQKLSLFAGWPVPILMVAGNHEFDQREWSEAWPALRAQCQLYGIQLLEQECTLLTDRQGRRIRFLGTTRWCDFELFGAAQYERAMKSASYFTKIMQATIAHRPLDAQGIRTQALLNRAWLQAQLMAEPPLPASYDATVVITHYAPSARSADPRYGAQQPTTASFCNADDDLLPYAQLWIHGHVHCRHDYQVTHVHGTTHVVANPRGLPHKREDQGFNGLYTVQV